METTPSAHVRLAPGLACVVAAALFAGSGCDSYSVLGVETPDAVYWKGYALDAGRIVSTPARMTGRDWLLAAGIVGGVAALQLADADLREAVQTSRSPESNSAADIGNALGSGYYVYPGLLAGYGLGAALGDGRLKETALLGLEGVTLSGVLCGVLKSAFGRARPNEGLGPDAWEGFGSGLRSMPSGHTTVAFALATAVHLEYRNRWASAAAYSLAVLAGWSRMNDDAHWASDVAAGAALGILVTNGIFRNWFRRTW